MRFEWDEQKNRQNLRKHDVRFETAVLVFDDPYALTQRDFTFEPEDRWITIGAIGPGSILLVVHTVVEDDDEIIRIISARAAESHERRAYEEAHKGTKARRQSHRRKARRRD
ncbi:MAG TPA: BrnT family toxin [Candidatus Sulfotelmatobacter sp.]|nr:BrnT family toxin [Candidatus Sulfotelmatobacter sp.]